MRGHNADVLDLHHRLDVSKKVEDLAGMLFCPRSELRDKAHHSRRMGDGMFVYFVPQIAHEILMRGTVVQPLGKSAQETMKGHAAFFPSTMK
jgi:hypothetical protein